MSNDDVTITKVPQRPIQRLEYDAPTKMYRRAPNVDEITEPKDYGLTFWQKVRLTPYVFQIFYGVMMKDAKTTIAGIVAAAAIVIRSIWGFEIPAIVTDSVIAIAVFLMGKFAADSSKAE